MAFLAFRAANAARSLMPGLKNMAGNMAGMSRMTGRSVPNMSGMMGRALPNMTGMPQEIPILPNTPKTILGVQTYTFLMLFLILILIVTIISLVVSTKSHIDDVCGTTKKK